MSPPVSFEELRLAATREFAHTMIVVDDEAWEPSPLGGAPRAGLRAPRRGLAPAPPQQDIFRVRHHLDAPTLIDAAMQLGLVCSVIRPPQGIGIQAKVREAARRADIICLDWELHNDSGASAKAIINQIVRQDQKQNGRLRLIAIYTGDTNSAQILQSILDSFPKIYRDRYTFIVRPGYIKSEHGLRIVCLVKAHGVTLPGNQRKWQVREKELPARLQREFANLAAGLLSTFALATIGSIRDSTHHVLAKMSERLDGPYFHHRAILPMASDAEDYGVEVVLSELKSAVDKKGVARKYAGREAISARIREIASGAANLTLHYDDKGTAKTFAVTLDDSIKLIVDGNSAAHSGVVGANKPSTKVFKREMSSLFANDCEAAHLAMRQFAAMTGVRSHPGSHLVKSGAASPQLGLGTILQNDKGVYYLCLQASCDSVRLKKDTPFLFVPLRSIEDEKADHHVPVLRPNGKVEYIGLAAPEIPYAVSRSISFRPDGIREVVLATKLKNRRGLFFPATDGEKFKWVADLKQRRALRTAQRLAQSMGRLGFDEFEPYRYRPHDD
jgi:hypothetical protein